MKVYITRLLCPKRHCILALAEEAGNHDLDSNAFVDALIDRIWRDFENGPLDPWCGICFADKTSWSAEVGRTGFVSLEEASPHLRELVARQSTHARGDQGAETKHDVKGPVSFTRSSTRIR